MDKIKKRIAFSGLICCDAFFVVDGFPAEDYGLACYDFRWALGGNGSNNSMVFSKLRNWFHSKYSSNDEIEIELLGTLSEDLPSKFLREILDRENIRYDRSFIDVNLKTPITGVIINSLNGSRTFTNYTEHYPDLTLEQYVRYDLVNYDWIHVEGRNNIKGLIEMVRFVRENQKLLDTNKKPIISVELEKDKVGLTDLFNEEIDYFFIEREFGSMKGWSNLEETIKETCKLIKHEAHVVFVWGEQGSRVVKVSQGKIIGPIGSTGIFPPRRGVVDTCGAGDTFLAATVFDIAVRGSKPEEAIIFGSKVAGAKVGMHGYDDLVNWESYI